MRVCTLDSLLAGGVFVHVAHERAWVLDDGLRELVRCAVLALARHWDAGAAAVLLHGARLHALPGVFSVQASEAHPRVDLRALLHDDDDDDTDDVGPPRLWAEVYRLPPTRAAVAWRAERISRYGHAPGWHPGVDFRRPELPVEVTGGPPPALLRGCRACDLLMMTVTRPGPYPSALEAGRCMGSGHGHGHHASARHGPRTATSSSIRLAREPRPVDNRSDAGTCVSECYGAGGGAPDCCC